MGSFMICGVLQAGISNCSRNRARGQTGRSRSGSYAEQPLVNLGNGLGRQLWTAIIRKKAVDLLLDVSELGVAESGHERQVRDALHNVAILRQKLVRLSERG